MPDDEDRNTREDRGVTEAGDEVEPGEYFSPNPDHPTLPELKEEEEKASQQDTGPERKKSPAPGAGEQYFTFSIVAQDENIEFAPVYFPESFNSTRSRDIESKISACKQELLIFKYIEGARIHAKGATLMNREKGLKAFQELHNLRDSRVTVTSNLLKDESLPCYIDETEFGEFHSYDATHEDWKIEYTIDLISLGVEGDTNFQGLVSEVSDSTDSIDLNTELTGVDEDNLR